MRTLAIDKTRDGQTITASCGDELELHLPENPTTGYRWRLVTLDDRLREASNRFEPGDAIRLGSGGIRTFQFTALSPGTAAIQLELVRPWHAADVAEHFAVSINISQQ